MSAESTGSDELDEDLRQVASQMAEYLVTQAMMLHSRLTTAERDTYLSTDGTLRTAKLLLLAGIGQYGEDPLFEEFGTESMNQAAKQLSRINWARTN